MARKKRTAEATQLIAVPKPAEPIKLDLGCGKFKQAGYIGVDRRPGEGVDVVADLTKPWMWATSSVDELRCSHMIEHLTPKERVHFVNEAYRVLKPKGTFMIVTPHWASPRAYGDLTHVWPPVSEFWFAYLNASWRKDQVPYAEDGELAYTCDFESNPPGYTVRPDIQLRNHEYQVFALANYKDAAQDMMVILVAKKETA